MQFQGKHSDVTGKILEAYFKVHRRLDMDLMRRFMSEPWSSSWRKWG